MTAGGSRSGNGGGKLSSLVLTSLSNSSVRVDKSLPPAAIALFVSDELALSVEVNVMGGTVDLRLSIPECLELLDGSLSEMLAASVSPIARSWQLRASRAGAGNVRIVAGTNIIMQPVNVATLPSEDRP
jgi:hypothetical protein